MDRKENQRIVNKLIDEGYSTSKDIAGLAVDQMIEIPGIRISDIKLIIELKKAITNRQLLEFFAGTYGQEKKEDENYEQ